jgi:hypothetical protein
MSKGVRVMGATLNGFHLFVQRQTTSRSLSRRFQLAWFAQIHLIKKRCFRFIDKLPWGQAEIGDTNFLRPVAPADDRFTNQS